MRRNDSFQPPAAALARGGGELPRSHAKWNVLFQPAQHTGVPLGGIGTGGIMRSSAGGFSRWTIKAGGVKHFALAAAGFVLRCKRSAQPPIARALQGRPADDGMSAFEFSATDAWHGLFPKAWHQHDPEKLGGVMAECLSFSPVVPGDLETASLPTALFRWRVTNTGDEACEASLAFLFPNLNGWFQDFDEGRPGRPAAGCHNLGLERGHAWGVIMDRHAAGPLLPESCGQWAIACKPEQGLELSRTLCFDGYGDGREFWDPFLAGGRAPDLGGGWVVEGGFRENLPGLPTGAVCAGVTLEAGASRLIEFALVWDLPVITFGQGRRWYRAYSDRWGRSGKAAEQIADYALNRMTDWDTEIDSWHEEIIGPLEDAPHTAGLAINELYFLVDGMSVFTSHEGAPDGRRHFGLIECHDYALYNTLDLWIYAAEAVGRHFPELAALVAHDYADQTLATDARARRHRWSHELFPINAPGCAPHDAGGPSEDPFVVPNSYTYRNGNRWKDLNCDFVLCVFRDGRAMGTDWRVNLFPAVRVAIDHLQQFDTDGDGLIENDGTPDQTFDNIPMLGASSYCGGLWIAALLAASQLASECGERLLARRWSEQAGDAAVAYENLLFNGEHFLVDTSGPLSGACFVEQVFGPFLARRLGLGDVIGEAVAKRALLTVFQRNFLDAGGSEGAVSLAGIPDEAFRSLPHADDRTFQTSEIQPGFNYSFAAQLKAWGLADEAAAIYRAMHHQLHVRRNLVFQTPAAFDRGGLSCRAVLNMRPLAAWWMLPPLGC